MHAFVEAFEFIGRNGSVPGEPELPTLTHLALQTLKVGAIGIAISAAVAVPLGVWLGHVHRGSFFAINLGNVGRALLRQVERWLDGDVIVDHSIERRRLRFLLRRFVNRFDVRWRGFPGCMRRCAAFAEHRIIGIELATQRNGFGPCVALTL